MNIDNFNYLAKDIKLLILDIDGVLTDGGLYFDDNGKEFKKFNSLDGQGIKLAIQNGIDVAIISARDNKSMKFRAQNLGITHYLTGREDKLNAFNEIKQKLAINNQQTAYIGDDILDLPVMTKIALPIAVNNAHQEVISHSVITTKRLGGYGAVREAIDLILKAQNKYQTIINTYTK